MLSACVPFDAPTVYALYDKIQHSGFTPLSRFNPSVPREVEAIVSRCLRKAPGARFSSAASLLHTVTAASDPSLQLSIPSEPRPPGASRVERKWLLENWPLSAAVFVLLTVLAGGFIWSLLPIREAGVSSATRPRQTVSSPTTAEIRTVLIDVQEGKAEVFREGKRVGSTPLALHADVGEHVDLLLRSQGYEDRAVSFTVTAATREFRLRMQKAEE